MRLLVVLTLTALVLAACGGGDTTDPGTPPTVPEETVGGVILEISDEGGFVPLEFNLTRVPRFTVFADGTVVTPAGEQFSFPGPALIRLVKRQLETETIADLLAFVDDLGLANLDAVDLSDAPNVADASTTVLRYFDGGGEHRISIYALGFGESGDARTVIVESMIARLDEATGTLDPEPYLADRMVVYTLGAEGLDPQQMRNAGPWPLDVAPDDMAAQVAGFSCVTIDGDPAEQLGSELSDADAVTTWTYEGAEFRILARPLLPHQDGC
jgi:hypothetical protein